jgi:hypothetical protein
MFPHKQFYYCGAHGAQLMRAPPRSVYWDSGRGTSKSSLSRIRADINRTVGARIQPPMQVLFQNARHITYASAATKCVLGFGPWHEQELSISDPCGYKSHSGSAHSAAYAGAFQNARHITYASVATKCVLGFGPWHEQELSISDPCGYKSHSGSAHSAAYAGAVSECTPYYLCKRRHEVCTGIRAVARARTLYLRSVRI